MFRKLIDAPKGHPKILKEKIGVVIGNLGTPPFEILIEWIEAIRFNNSIQHLFDYRLKLYQDILEVLLLPFLQHHGLEVNF